jgi:hypothetical protein
MLASNCKILSPSMISDVGSCDHRHRKGQVYMKSYFGRSTSIRNPKALLDVSRSKQEESLVVGCQNRGFPRGLAIVEAE